MNTDIAPHLWVTRVPLLPLLLHKMGRITADRLDSIYVEGEKPLAIPA